MRLTIGREKKVFYPDDPDKAYVIIQYLKPGVLEQIEALSNTVTAEEDSDGEFAAKVEFNLNKKRKLFYAKVALSWSGFKNVAGKDLKLTPHNIEKVAEELGGFYAWLQEESELFNSEVLDEEKEEEVNS